MPKLTLEGVGDFEIPQGKRLVLALEDDAGVDQLHACGGNARCTTCRVQFVAGEPDQMAAAEKQVLAARSLSGVRLSCQILCDHDMTVRAISVSRQRSQRCRPTSRRTYPASARSMGGEIVNEGTLRDKPEFGEMKLDFLVSTSVDGRQVL